MSTTILEQPIDRLRAAVMYVSRDLAAPAARIGAIPADALSLS